MKIKAFHGSTKTFDRFNPLSHFGSIEAANAVIEEKVEIQDSDSDKNKVLSSGVIYEVELDLKRPYPISDNKGVHASVDWAYLICHPPAVVCHESGVFGLSMDDIDAVRALKDYIFQPIDYALSKAPAFPKSLPEEDIRLELVAGDIFEVKNLFPKDRQSLCYQRMINELKKLGFDSFVYINKAEDRGHISWITFDPEQVTILASSSYVPGTMQPAADIILHATPQAPERASLKTGNTPNYQFGTTLA